MFLNLILKKNNLKFFVFASLLAVLLPSVAFGAFSGTYFESVLLTIKNIVGGLIPVIIGLAFIFFAWSLISYIRSSGDDKVKNKSQLIWSVIAIVLIVSIWGITNLMQSIFLGSGTNNTITLPVVPGLGNVSAPASPAGDVPYDD